MGAASTTQMLQEYLGRQVRKARGDRSQTWLARAVGVDQTTISKIERGVYKLSPELMLGICAAVGMELDQVFAWPPGLVSRERFERESKQRLQAASA